MFEQSIFHFAKEYRVLMGICDANPLDDIKPYLNKETPFVPSEIDVRTTPQLRLPNAKSIIVIGVPYGKKERFVVDQKDRGRLSMSAVGCDYHIQVRLLLQMLANRLQAHGTFDYQIDVDTGPLIERALAVKAGLGFVGKNCNIISKQYGSYFFIGTMIVSMPLKPSEPQPMYHNFCDQCQRCQKACPTDALSIDFSCDAYRCVSYLTQCKEDIPLPLRAKMKTALYGCDLCQKVCPYNKDKEIEIITDQNITRPLLDPFLSLSNKQFKQQYGKTAIAWRGKKTLQRNATYAKDYIKKQHDFQSEV